MYKKFLVGSILLALSAGANAVSPGKFTTSDISQDATWKTLTSSSKLADGQCSVPGKLGSADLEALIQSKTQIILQYLQGGGCELVGFYDKKGDLIPYDSYKLIDFSQNGDDVVVALDTQTKEAERRALLSASVNGDLTLIDKTKAFPGFHALSLVTQKNSSVYAVKNWPRLNAITMVEDNNATAKVRNLSVSQDIEFVSKDTVLFKKNNGRSFLMDKTGQRSLVNVGNGLTYTGTTPYINLYQLTDGQQTGVYSAVITTPPDAEWQQADVSKLVPELSNQTEVAMGTLDFWHELPLSFDYYEVNNTAFTPECHIITSSGAYNLFGDDITKVDYMNNPANCEVFEDWNEQWPNYIVVGTFMDAELDQDSGKFNTPLTPFIGVQTSDSTNKISLAGTELESFNDQVIYNLLSEVPGMKIDELTTSGVQVMMPLEDFSAMTGYEAEFTLKINSDNKWEVADINLMEW